MKATYAPISQLCWSILVSHAKSLDRVESQHLGHLSNTTSTPHIYIYACLHNKIRFVNDEPESSFSYGCSSSSSSSIHNDIWFIANVEECSYVCCSSATAPSQGSRRRWRRSWFTAAAGVTTGSRGVPPWFTHAGVFGQAQVVGGLGYECFPRKMRQSSDGKQV